MGYEAYLRVSDIPVYLSCPKKLYFSYRGEKIEPEGEALLESIFYKELSFRLHEIEDFEEDVRSLFDELPVIYPEKIGKLDPPVLEAFRDRIISSCGRIKEAAGEVMAFYEKKGVCILETGRYVLSRRLLLSGSVDKVVRMKDGTVAPVSVRSGRAPSDGVWKGDRMRIAAYSILLGEELGDNLSIGLVEYIREGIVREVKIRDYDRRRVLRVLRMMRRIKQGTIPDGAHTVECKNCPVRDECVVERSLLSRFF
ncbi:MAG: Dna2/Cas4 domain-containing protein [Candidatus Syntrophoarchaeum sp. WYZ-LMO15]|nr:MAG: Dna2/Cas4 domain-containing protein [Candidatus Syntrophoarchaeum sp. WYZ-LMO15]